jgi:hypothetical protein
VPQLSVAVIWAGVLGTVGIIIFISHRIPLSSPRYGHQGPQSLHGLPTRPGSSPWRSNHALAIGNGTNFATGLRAIDWFQLERLVAVVYRRRGYWVTRFSGANPDGGIHLIAEKSGERLAIQCSRWKSWRIGLGSVRDLLGALSAAGISKGMLATPRGYTNEAREFAAKNGIILVDERQLVEMLKGANAEHDSEILSIFENHRELCPRCKMFSAVPAED